jgi:diguanylate cyclase (GGDEF)-like protein
LSTRPLQLLIVEPDDASAARIESLLRNAGARFSTHRASELHEALEYLERGGVDVILLDLDLPDCQGIETFERLRAFAPTVPAVVLTADADEETALASLQGGAQDFLLEAELTPGILTRSLLYAVERHRLMAALRSLSLIDDLTGLYNRRGFGDLGEQYLKLSRRSARPLTLVFLDLDSFKHINDTLGHHVGDRALLRIADILRSTFRASDLMARLGGDEFAVLAPEASDEPPEVLVERVRDAVKRSNDAGRDPFHLSVSIGTSRYSGDSIIRLDDLLAEADAVMYREKRSKKPVRSA